MCEHVLHHSPVSLSRGSNRMNIRQTSNLSPRLVVVSYSHAQSCALCCKDFRVSSCERRPRVASRNRPATLPRKESGPLGAESRTTDAAGRRRKRRSQSHNATRCRRYPRQESTSPLLRFARTVEFVKALSPDFPTDRK